MKIDLAIPTGANCLSFNFRFLSEEFPVYVGTAFNDAFIAELDTTNWTTSGSTITAPHNFAFDSSNAVVSINSTGLGGMSAANGAGTAFDGKTTGPGADSNGAATALLGAATQVTSGSHSLYLSLFDQGDNALNSAVFLDNLQVLTVPNPAVDCHPGATQTAHLTLAKTVDNTGGGTALAGAWTLSATGPTPISGHSGDPAVTAAVVGPGTYSLAESGGPAGYSAGAWSCTGGTLSGSSLVLAAGDSASCSITNTFIPPLQADLSVTKTDAPDPVTVGAPLTYTLTVHNAGPRHGQRGDRVRQPGGLGQPRLGDRQPGQLQRHDHGQLRPRQPRLRRQRDGRHRRHPGQPGTAQQQRHGRLVHGRPGDRQQHRGHHHHGRARGRADRRPVRHQDRRRRPAPCPARSTTYTIVVSNAGPERRQRRQRVRPLPGRRHRRHLDGVSAGGVSGSRASGSGNINDHRQPARRRQRHLHLHGPDRPAATGTLSNTATVTPPAGATDPDPANNSATDTDTPDARRRPVDHQDRRRQPAVPGTSTTYTIVVSNAGPSAVTRRDGADTLPGRHHRGHLDVRGHGGGDRAPRASGSGNINDHRQPARRRHRHLHRHRASRAPRPPAPWSTPPRSRPRPARPTQPRPTTAPPTPTRLTPAGRPGITKTDGARPRCRATPPTYTIVGQQRRPRAPSPGRRGRHLPGRPHRRTWTCVGDAGGGTVQPASGSGTSATTVNLPVGGSVDLHRHRSVDPGGHRHAWSTPPRSPRPPA